MASVVDICNRGLQKLGSKRITSLGENSASGRACNAAYEACRDAELRKHTWNFAVDRATLAADATPPARGRTNAFQLPADYIRLAPKYVEDNMNTKDWVIEGQKILTNYSAPLDIRYVKKVTDPNLFDPLFREALSCRMAIEMCEELTQSNQKIQVVAAGYKDAVSEAKRVNAMENVSPLPPIDEWITVRA